MWLSYAARVAAVCAFILTTCPARAGEADFVWPKSARIGDTEVILHQPQGEAWKDQRRLTAKMVVELAPKGQDRPHVGAVWFEGDTVVDSTSRMVHVTDARVVKVKFPSLDDVQSRAARETVASAAPREWRDLPLDVLLADIERTKGAEKALVGREDPPAIYVRHSPTILALIDGPPVLSPIEGNDLLFVVNTNWDLFFHPKENVHYLLNRDTWLRTSDLKQGPWLVADRLPADFSNLPKREDWEDVRANLNPKRVSGVHAPEVIVSEVPAELIVLDGAPKLRQIGGTRLFEVTNADGDLFFFGGDGRYYFLASGRWFHTKSLDGAWSFVEELPRDFALIPPDHPRAYILASVPGSPTAEEALLAAQIPQKAAVRRSDARLDVSYVGAPVFEAIDGADDLMYAVNTSYAVVRYRGRHYACHGGVWFVSDAAVGPWTVCDNVPVVIYRIPPSCPIFFVTYVYVYRSTPDVVVVGYTPGYYGCYSRRGVVVYGTGRRYRPFTAPGPHPTYLRRPNTYGIRAVYDPGTYSFMRGSRGTYGPYGGLGRSAEYRPDAPGRYTRSSAAWGPRDGVYATHAYTPAVPVFRPEARRNDRDAQPRAISPYSHLGKSVIATTEAISTLGRAGASKSPAMGIRPHEGPGRPSAHDERKQGETHGDRLPDARPRHLSPPTAQPGQSPIAPFGDRKPTHKPGVEAAPPRHEPGKPPADVRPPRPDRPGEGRPGHGDRTRDDKPAPGPQPPTVTPSKPPAAPAVERKPETGSPTPPSPPAGARPVGPEQKPPADMRPQKPRGTMDKPKQHKPHSPGRSRGDEPTTPQPPRPAPAPQSAPSPAREAPKPTPPQTVRPQAAPPSQVAPTPQPPKAAPAPQPARPPQVAPKPAPPQTMRPQAAPSPPPQRPNQASPPPRPPKAAPAPQPAPPPQVAPKPVSSPPPSPHAVRPPVPAPQAPAQRPAVQAPAPTPPPQANPSRNHGQSGPPDRRGNRPGHDGDYRGQKGGR